MTPVTRAEVVLFLFAVVARLRKSFPDLKNGWVILLVGCLSLLMHAALAQEAGQLAAWGSWVLSGILLGGASTGLASFVQYHAEESAKASAKRIGGGSPSSKKAG